jgi:hypothetical protein
MRTRLGRVILSGIVLSLLATGLVLVDADAAWRRVTRSLDNPIVNDLQVCTDGIRVLLGTSLQLREEDPVPVSYAREGFRVTTGAVDEFDEPQPTGTDLLLLEPAPYGPDGLQRVSDVHAPKVPSDDPRLAGLPLSADRHYYLLEETLPWNAAVPVGSTVHLWVVGAGQWRSGGADPAVTVQDCRLFGPPPVTVSFDANVLSKSNEIRPDRSNLTIFEVSGANIDPKSVRFGAPGQEKAAIVVKVRGRIKGVADLRSRGLGCSATVASVTGRTVTGEPFAATDVVRPVCRR